MTDYYLKFPDEATSYTIAQNLGIVIETPEGIRLDRFNEHYAIDVIGEIVLPDDSSGQSITLQGWHVNLRIIDDSPLPAELQPYTITVANPYRVWA